MMQAKTQQNYTCAAHMAARYSMGPRPLKFMGHLALETNLKSNMVDFDS